MNEGLFKKGDMFVVPDDGAAAGDTIEIAEKSRLLVKITVTGKQFHAASPEYGINAFREAAKYVLEADGYLHRKYSRKTQLMPDGSTFEMTKHEKNIDSVIILPGKEVFYMDCRILPCYKLMEIVKDLRKLGRKRSAKITVEVVVAEDSAEPVRDDSEIVKRLRSAIKKVLRKNARLIGIGGGTMAVDVRNAGFDAAVWTIEP